LERIEECRDAGLPLTIGLRVKRDQHADPPGLLRPHCERPRSRRAAEQRDELAALHAHSITSSARASRLSGKVSPSALAVLRLITVSYFPGACTGRSPGFSPLRMRPV